MTAWEELRLTLARLLEDRPGAVTSTPNLDESDGGPPPYPIRLAPWAEAVAGELHGRFGDQVDLTVGALPYPPAYPPAYPPGRAPRGPQLSGEPAALLDPAEAGAELDGPAVVRSGHTLRHGLLIGNRTGAELTIATNGQVTAVVVDPGTGEVVGGYSGFQTLPLVMFQVPPGGTERIPLLIGTASFTGRLGYAVPPGSWGIEVTLQLTPDPDVRDRVPRRTPVLPLTVTA
jgi:hypothetical protein